MNDASNPMPRRRFLYGAALATAGLAARGIPLGAAEPSAIRTYRGEPRPETPDEALERLLEGNRRFASGAGTGLHRDLDRVRELSTGQSPFAAILSCADSRVPPELLFDQGFGDLFVVRVAGNVAGTEEVASLEYAVGPLGASVLMVLGHTSCGAVSATMAGGPVPGRISSLYTHIAPAIAEAGQDLAAAVAANVRIQADLIRTSSPVMGDALQAGQLKVVGGVYDLATGLVSLLEDA